MPYTKLEPQPGPREEGLDWEEAADGLYPGEVAVQLSTGHCVAVNVEGPRGYLTPKWIETGEGVALVAYARWIDEAGRTRFDKHGQHVEGVLCSTLSAADIELHGLDALQREAMRVVLGEEPALFEIPVDPEAPPPPEVAVDEADWQLHLGGENEKAPPGTVFAPAQTHAEILRIDPSARLNASIRRAIEMADVPDPDAGALLGI